jgi:hypothetical protein
VDTNRIKADGQHLITSERMGLKPASARIAQIGSEVARCKATNSGRNNHGLMCAVQESHTGSTPDTSIARMGEQLKSADYKCNLLLYIVRHGTVGYC